MMTIKEAKVILEQMGSKFDTDENEELRCSAPWIFQWNENYVSLDGDFNPEQLEALIIWMRR